GGADMPVVICLLNSYSGMAACASGFVVVNNLLIVAGALVGASGIILTIIMCKAMNRSIANVLFGGFGATVTAGSGIVQGEVKPVTASDAYLLLEAASSVVFVPGYGLAVSQAQHTVRELAELMEKNGTEVRFAIHPVAGRMPGHMNVLLAEANVSYEHLQEMDAVNPIMDSVDVSIVVGANDVVNPAAKEDKSSPLYGMPIIEVDRSRTVIVMKRSMNPGFAGVDNPLFFKNNTRMLFGDAKASIQALVNEFKSSAE
ncbi:MAG: NAD(P)(+) transhydrogenase (Re/Si-specific) subunit beta, partial [Bacteroidetes bacterium]|nr:NAD(P)(+) transhydrogenase (Re/Si-specific) subunit beta [Bacteroidota bacterium]